MTDTAELNQLIEWARRQGADVQTITGEDSIYENGDACYRVVGMPGVGPYPMTPIAFAERMRELRAAVTPMIRTIEQLESDLDQHEVNKWDHLTVRAIEAGNAGDAQAFATKLAHLLRQRAEDVREFGDEPTMLADFRDERASSHRCNHKGDDHGEYCHYCDFCPACCVCQFWLSGDFDPDKPPQALIHVGIGADEICFGCINCQQEVQI